MIRVLHVHGAMEKGGTESVIMNIYRNIDRNKFQFEFTKFNNIESAYDSEIITLGGKFHQVKSRQEYGNLEHIKSLYRLFKQNKFDVIHTHMNFHGGIVAVIAKICGVRTVVCHAHSSSEDDITFKRLLEINFLKMLIRLFSDYQIACSEKAAEFCFFKNSKYNILTNAVDLKQYYPITSDINIENSNKIKIIHIGRFVPVKNHRGIIEIAKQLKRLNIDFEVSLLGEGELMEEIQTMVEKYSLINYVNFLGIRSQINELLNEHDVCIMPSFYEGLPVALVEAQATGIPCIVSENVSSEVDMGLGNLYFVDVNDVNQWVKIIQQTYKNKITDISFIEECFSNRGYNLDENIRKISKIYER